ncbi:MAG TPA: hypothetical protein VE978_10990 [Chitinophagales bacterium]|nr:hypothetical protein [Chitinophagales bacterium]
MRYSLWLPLILLPSLSFSQKIKPEYSQRLPNEIHESSGLALMRPIQVFSYEGKVIDSLGLCTVNDGGDKERVFYITKKYGEPYPQFWVMNAANHDWEDLALDDSSNLYIGDFGNGLNRRRNLGIYKVYVSPARLNFPFPSPAFVDSASLISIHYPDQKQFPPPPSNWNFDCEAFFHHRDSLYIFSKNLSSPNDGYTKMYRLPDQPGNYTAELVDSFYLNEPVTSADISPDGKTIVLLTYFSLWVFKDFPDHNFFDGKIFQFPFNGLTQKEAICFANDHELFMTDERHFGKGGKLYKIDLNQLDFSRSTSKYKKQHFKRAIYNAFNNPKAKYKRIMKREAAQ